MKNPSGFQGHEMGMQKLEKRIFIGDSAVTSQMTSDPTGLYNLQTNSASEFIGNGQNIKCTHRGSLDVVCIQNDGSTARDTCEIKLVPRLNHNLFSFTSAMKEEWQMNCRWKKQGIEIELDKKGHESFFFDQMISSG